MRLTASLGALAGLAFLTVLHTDWSQPVPTASAFAPQNAIEIGRCASRTDLVEAVKYYDFFGAREQDADRSFRQSLLVSQDFTGAPKRFAGQADWHIDWLPCLEPRGAGCRLSGVTAIASTTYTLPRWADRDMAVPGLRRRWDRYAEKLQMHERGHGAVALKIAGEFEHELVGIVDLDNCEEVAAEARRRVEALIRRGEAMQNEYDRITGHGQLQGAVFPF